MEYQCLTYTQKALNKVQKFDSGSYNPKISQQEQLGESRTVRTDTLQATKMQNVGSGFDLIGYAGPSIYEGYKNWRYGDLYKAESRLVESILSEYNSNSETERIFEINYIGVDGRLEIEIFDTSERQWIDPFNRPVELHPDYKDKFQFRSNDPLIKDKLKERLDKELDKSKPNKHEENKERWKQEPISMPQGYYDHVSPPSGGTGSGGGDILNPKPTAIV